MATRAKDPISVFLRRRTFFCTHLLANITPEVCCARQMRKVEQVRFGQKFTLNNDPQARFCRSGDCRQGKEQKVKLKLRRSRAQEKRAARCVRRG